MNTGRQPDAPLPAVAPSAHLQSKIIELRRKQVSVAVLTGTELAADKVGNLICGWMIHSKDGSPMKEPAHPPLAVDRVRYVGDQLAVVIAETKNEAKLAAAAATTASSRNSS